jgi:hypothetical protein
VKYSFQRLAQKALDFAMMAFGARCLERILSMRTSSTLNMCSSHAWQLKYRRAPRTKTRYTMQNHFEL